jgi:hypothetical protein
MASYVVTTLDALAPEHCEKISVTGEDNMEPGEARVYWGAGQARRSPAQVWQAVMAALLPALDSPEVKDMNNGK